MPSFRAASVSSSLGATFACNKPTGTVQGDVLFLCHTADIGALTDLGTPSGGATWILLDSASFPPSSAGGMKIWWKVAGSSEPSAYGLTHQRSDADNTCSIICVQDAPTSTPVVAQTGGSTSSTSIPTPSTVPNGIADFEIRFVGAPTGGSFTPPAGFTERTDRVSNVSRAPQSSATRTLSGSGATGVHNFTPIAALSSYLGFTINIGIPAPTPVFSGWGMPI